jgi:hypothetical protein
MKLSANEIRDITRHLEAGRPLPDHYRFLLFDDKREVELVWNGKTNELCNMVLPFQAIELVDEPRAEKPADTALRPASSIPAAASSRPGPSSSVKPVPSLQRNNATSFPKRAFSIASSATALSSWNSPPFSKTAPTSSPTSKTTWPSNSSSVLAQPEMERGRFPLVSIPPFGRRFSRHL